MKKVQGCLDKVAGRRQKLRARLGSPKWTKKWQVLVELRGRKVQEGDFSEEPPVPFHRPQQQDSARGRTHEKTSNYSQAISKRL